MNNKPYQQAFDAQKSFYTVRKDGHSHARFSALLKTMNGVFFFFFYEILILILIKTKSINVCCFQVITNQTNLDYLFQ